MASKDSPNDRNDRSTDDEAGGESLGRRSYLKAAGATVGFGALSAAGAVQNSSAGTTRNGISFDRTVNAVDDLGMDPTGGSAVDSQLDDGIADGTLIEFPEGEYLVTQKHVLSGGTFGFLGTGDVRFVASQGYNDDLFVSPASSPADEVLFENIDVDIRKDNTTAGMKMYTQYGFHLEGIEYVGRGMHSDSDVIKAWNLGVLDSGSTGVIKNCVAKKGSTWARYKAGDGRTGIGVYRPHEGTVRIVDCHLEEFGNDGIYASRCPGNVQVEGGVYRNINAAMIRIAGDGSYADGAVVEVDPEKYTGPRESDYEDNAFALRGFIAEQKTSVDSLNKSPGVEVRNCEFVFKDNPSGVSAAIQSKYTGKTLKVKNCRIEHDVDGQPAVRRDPQSDGSYPASSDPRWLRMDGVSITGSASNSAAVLVADGDDSVIENCCIQQTGSDRDGVRFSDSTNCTVRDTNFTVTGSPIVTSGSSVSTSNLTTGESCPAPNLDGGSTDTSVAVATRGASNVDDSSATLAADLTDLGGASSADVYLEWGESGSGLGNATATKTVSSTGTVTWTVDGLQSSTTYDYRAVASASDGDADTGTTASFTTGSGLGNTITVEGGSADNKIPYQFSVSGDLAKGPNANDNDSVSGSTADGQVAGGYDDYEFSGEVTDFTADSDLSVTINGQTVDEDQLGTSLDNDLAVSGGTADDKVNYTFTVSGDLRKGDLANDYDTVSGSTADGRLGGGTDTYEFSGEVTDFSADGDVTLEINGQTVDEEKYASYGNTIAVEGTQASTTYEFTVSGELKGAGDLESGDSVSGSTASGAVGDGGVDTYEFSGEVVSFSHDGNPTVTLNGRTFSANQWLGVPNPVVFDGSAASGADYSLSASQDLVKDPTAAPLDGSATVDGTSASGTLDGGTDGYRYAGELTDLSVAEGIAVSLTDRD